MVQTGMMLGIKRMLSVAQVCSMILVTLVSISWGAQEKSDIASKCTFTKYLAAHNNQARYVNTYEKARATYAEQKSYDNAAMYGIIAKARLGEENGENLDSFSAGCLSCHDGKSASNVRPNVLNNPGKKGLMSMISGKHPIGMDYLKYSEANTSLKTLDEMSQNLTLVEGRVSCITCHDPLNNSRYNLRIISSGIDLCAACHNM